MPCEYRSYKGPRSYTDRVPFDEVWLRADLAKRDRGLVTITALAATGKPDQWRFHLGLGGRVCDSARGRDWGITDLEALRSRRTSVAPGLRSTLYLFTR